MDRRLVAAGAIRWRGMAETWNVFSELPSDAAPGRIRLAPPVDGIGLYVGGVIETDAGLVVLGMTSANDTGEGTAYLWVESASASR